MLRSMPFPDNNHSGDETVHKTVLILLAIALNIFEQCIPRIPFFPWLKPGVANCITIIWIVRYGVLDAMLFTLLRVWLSSFFIGFSLVTMSLALSGGLLSTLAMGVCGHPLRNNKKTIGTIGTGIIGALFHNGGQLIAVYLLLVKNDIIFYQLPFMLAASLLFGSLTGVLAPLFLKVFSQVISIKTTYFASRYTTFPNVSSGKLLGSVAIFIAAIALLAITDRTICGIIAGAGSLSAFLLTGRKWATITHPLRFWFLFVIIAFVYIFFSYGTRIPQLPFVTYEGINDAIVQSLRLWTWIEISLILHAWQINHALFMFLKKLFPHHGSSLTAGLFALDFFPEIIRFTQSKKAREDFSWKHPLSSLSLLVERICYFILGLIERENRSSAQESTASSS